MVQILLAAAFGPELEPFTQRIGFSSSIRTIAVGVGMVEAAANAGFLLSMGSSEVARSNALLFVGSCGATDRSIPLGTVVIASEARLSDETLSHGKGYLPELCTSRVIAATSLTTTLREAIKAEHLFEPLYSSVAITRDESVGLAHRRFCNARLENMELFGVALACRNQSIPWAAMSIVTNHTWERGHQEWKSNHTTAARRTAELLVPLLPLLASAQKS